MLPGPTPYDVVPLAERPHTDALRNGLLGLQGYVGGFAHALSLYDRCEREMTDRLKAGEFPHDLMAWQNIAARDAVFQVFHFRERMKGIASSLDNSPTVRPHVDQVALRALEGRFDSTFASYRDLRHAIAHAAEFAATAEEFKKNAFVGGDDRVGVWTAQPQVMSMMHNRTYTATRRGKLFSLDLTVESLQSLIAFRDDYYRLFNCWHEI
jgi:hypothetical protein